MSPSVVANDSGTGSTSSSSVSISVPVVPSSPPGSSTVTPTSDLPHRRHARAVIRKVPLRSRSEKKLRSNIESESHWWTLVLICLGPWASVRDWAAGAFAFVSSWTWAVFEHEGWKSMVFVRQAVRLVTRLGMAIMTGVEQVCSLLANLLQLCKAAVVYRFHPLFLPSTTVGSKSTTAGHLAPLVTIQDKRATVRIRVLTDVLKLLLVVCVTWMVWKAIEMPADCSLLPVLMPPSPCGHSGQGLIDALKQDHGYTAGSPRYYFHGKWMHFETLRFHYKFHKRNAKLEDLSRPPCVLVSVDKEFPCMNRSCVIPLYIRPDSSDLTVLRTMFEPATSDHPFRRLMDAVTEGVQVRGVLDAGANIGITTACFSFLFPQAHIVAVEPSLESFRVLQLNTEYLHNITRVHAALWSHLNANLQVHEVNYRYATKGHREWGYMVTPTNHDAKGKVVEVVSSMTVPLVQQISGVPAFDFVKMDVEGSEKMVFTDRGPKEPEFLRWLDSVQVAFVGIHEMQRAGAEAAVQSAFSKSFSMELGPTHNIYWRALNRTSNDTQI